MKNESIRKSIIIGVFVLGVFALVSSDSNEVEKVEEVTYYPITEVQSAQVLGAVDSLLNVFDGSIPACVGSVTNSSNSNNCIVADCSDPPISSIGDSALTESEISDCVGDTEVGDYSEEQLGCLAGQCLMHGISSSSNVEATNSRKTETGDPVDPSIPDCIESFVNTPSAGEGDPGSCSVKDCDNTTVTVEGALSDEQMEGCLGDTEVGDASYAQLGCLANECLNHENAPSSSSPVALESIQPGQSNPTIYVVEVELKAKGFFTLAPDTVFGYKTIEAIKLFQASVRLPATGILDQKTLAEILK